MTKDESRESFYIEDLKSEYEKGLYEIPQDFLCRSPYDFLIFFVQKERSRLLQSTKNLHIKKARMSLLKVRKFFFIQNHTGEVILTIFFQKLKLVSQICIIKFQTIPFKNITKTSKNSNIGSYDKRGPKQKIVIEKFC